MKKVFKHLIFAAIALTAATLQSCSDTEEKTGLAKDIEGVWESVYFHDDESIYEVADTYGEWHQYTLPGSSGTISRDDEDYNVMKFVNGTVSIVASNGLDEEDQPILGMKFPYQIKGDRITSLLFQPETDGGYYAIEDMTEDSFKLVNVEKGYYVEDLEPGNELRDKVIHERYEITYKRIK